MSEKELEQQDVDFEDLDDSERYCMACSDKLSDTIALVCLDCLGEMYVKAAEKKLKK